MLRHYSDFIGSIVKLVFDLLPTGNLGSFVSLKGEGKIMVFPADGFTPKVGESYDCYLRLTHFGRWEDSVHNVEYRTAHARPTDASNPEADPWEVYRFREKQQETNQGTNPFAALAGMKDELPEKYDVVDLVVDVDRKNGGFMFKVQYVAKDMEAGGMDSMRFFHPTNKVEMAFGKCFEGRIEKIVPTGKTNSKGAAILRVHVKVLEEKKTTIITSEKRKTTLGELRERQPWRFRSTIY
jgi:hypothetical protein